MMCKNPYVKGNVAFGCGQCLPCRINRKRLWTHRILLESLKHPVSCFITLTYSQESLPGTGSLDPKHAQDFLKRLRRAVEPQKIRFYLVGEYGSQTWRPHYHAVIFGLGADDALVIAKAWKMGNVQVGTLTAESAAYCAGYVTKKMTSKTHPLLEGRYPEFCRMSLRPGIGAEAMQDVADLLTTQYGCLALSDGDVPLSLKHGGRDLPLGRYLRRRLRSELGIEEMGYQSPGLRAKAAELSDLFKKHGANTAHSKKNVLVEVNRQRVRNLEVKYKIFAKKEKI